MKRSLIVLGVGMLLVGSPQVAAQTLQSPNYQFDETSIGTGSLEGSSSSSYGISESTGDLGVGESESANFKVQAGTKTTHDPTLSFVVTKSDAKFPPFSASQPATATTEFSVSNYTAWGYTVQLYGTPPKNGNHTIAAMEDTPSTSQVGIEQFGLNLVANTLPQSLGKNPDNGDFGSGEVGTGTADTTYSSVNKYFFRNGDTVASAPRSSGETKYTISYVANVAGNTPGGQYKAQQMLVVVGKY